MFIMPSLKKSLIVEQFQGNYLNSKLAEKDPLFMMQLGTLQNHKMFLPILQDCTQNQKFLKI